MSYKQQKQRLQICVTYEDLAFIEKFGEKTGAKNASEAIHELIYDNKLMETGIHKFKEKLLNQEVKQTYEQVRNEQLKVPPAPPPNVNDPLKKDEWAWLRGNQGDPSQTKTKQQRDQEYIPGEISASKKSGARIERFKPTKRRTKK